MNVKTEDNQYSTGRQRQHGRASTVRGVVPILFQYLWQAVGCGV